MENDETKPNTFLFGDMLTVAGVLHILHSVSEQHHHVMQKWPAFLEDLRHVTKLLCNRHSRERFIAQCLQACDALPQEITPFCRQFPALIEWRWSSVFLVLQWLLPLQSVLQSRWDPKRYGGEISVDEGGETMERGEDPPNLAVLTAAIQSDFFWGFATMCQQLQVVLDGFRGWVESCPCHSQAGGISDTLERSTKRWQRIMGNESTMWRTCPLAGRRAPEMATGDWKDVIATLAQLSVMDVVSGLPRTLLQVDREIILSDFRAAQSHLQSVLTVKFSYWGHLPHKLAGLLHPDPSKSRECAADSLQLFDATPILEWHHRVSLKVLKHNSKTRQQLEAYAFRGAHLEELPELLKLALQMGLMPITERCIEMRHSLVKMALGVKKKTHPVRVSLANRLPELNARLQATPSILPSLSLHLDSLRNCRKIASVFGFRAHPALQRLIEGGRHHPTFFNKPVVEIFYRTELSMQFQGLDHHRAEQAALLAHHKKLSRQAGKALVKKATVLQHLAQQHAVQTLKKESATGRSFLTIPLLEASATLELFTLEGPRGHVIPLQTLSANLPGFLFESCWNRGIPSSALDSKPSRELGLARGVRFVGCHLTFKALH